MNTIKQASRKIGCSDSLVRKLINQKLLDAIDIGTGGRRSLRISDDAIERFLQSRLIGHETPKPRRTIKRPPGIKRFYR